jgi:adenylate cyclase
MNNYKSHLEIERKFLVKGDFKSLASSKIFIKQGYLSSVPERVVRIRRFGDKSFITIKGIASNNGLSRFEFEHEISINDAENLLKICEPGMIEKVRYIVPYNGKKFEVDEFFGHLSGLVLAELELEREDEPFEKPEWLGEEVTGNPKYFNSNLKDLVL